MAHRWFCRASHPSAAASVSPLCLDVQRSLNSSLSQQLHPLVSFGALLPLCQRQERQQILTIHFLYLASYNPGRKKKHQTNDDVQRKNPLLFFQGSALAHGPGSGFCAGPGGTGEGATRWQRSTVPWPARVLVTAPSRCFMQKERNQIGAITRFQLCNSKTTNTCPEIQIRSKSKILVSSDALFQGKYTFCKQKAVQQVRVQRQQLYHCYKIW